MRKFKKRQKVYWNDPVGETSGEYEVYNAPEMEDVFSGDEEIEDLDDRIILIGNGISEAEVYAAELDMLDPLSGDEAHNRSDICNRFNDYIEKHGKKPQIAVCHIVWQDDRTHYDVKIKLNTEIDTDDDEIFFYCSEYDGFISLAFSEEEEFFISEVKRFE